MKLIVGLGNAGAQYVRTRHNLGFLVLEQLAQRLTTNARWQEDKKFKALVIKLSALGLILVKPQTFVNNSGEAIGKIAQFYKIEPANILIIRDDIDLPEGKLRGPKAVTGSGGHLGAESIIENLGSNNFYQLKIGVGRPPEDVDPADFVLQKVPEKVWQNFKNLIVREVVAKVQDWING